MTTAAQLTSADELLAMPKDGYRYELVAGELRKMTPAGFEHGIVIMHLAEPLSAYARQQRLGYVLGAETGFHIAKSPDTVRAPDIAFVRSDRLPTGEDARRFFPGPPDLAVEVVSPGDTTQEVEEKAQAWLAAGTPLVWVVNPAWRNVVVYRSATDMTTLTEEDTLTGGEVVPGFEYPVRDIFLPRGS